MRKQKKVYKKYNLNDNSLRDWKAVIINAARESTYSKLKIFRKYFNAHIIFNSPVVVKFIQGPKCLAISLN